MGVVSLSFSTCQRVCHLPEPARRLSAQLPVPRHSILALIGALKDKIYLCEGGFLEESGGLSGNWNSLRELSVLRIEVVWQ